MTPLDFFRSSPQQQEQFMRAVIQQRANNNDPLAQNLLTLINGGNPQQAVQDFARNYCKEKGIDFDSSFQAFQNNMRGFFGK